MKKTRFWLLALAALFLLTAVAACDAASSGSDEPSADYVYFQNDTGCKVYAFYISTTDADSWGEKLNWGDYVGVGSKIHIDAAKLVNGPGVYDVGAVDETDLVYEVYEVELAPGDTISLSASGEDVTCLITHLDGSQSEWVGYASYLDEEAVG